MFKKLTPTNVGDYVGCHLYTFNSTSQEFTQKDAILLPKPVGEGYSAVRPNREVTIVSTLSVATGSGWWVVPKEYTIDGEPLYDLGWLTVEGNDPYYCEIIHFGNDVITLIICDDDEKRKVPEKVDRTIVVPLENIRGWSRKKPIDGHPAYEDAKAYLIATGMSITDERIRAFCKIVDKHNG